LTDVFGEDPMVGSFFRMEPAGKRGEPIVFYKEGGELRAARFMSGEEGHALYETLTTLPTGLSGSWRSTALDLIGGAAHRCRHQPGVRADQLHPRPGGGQASCGRTTSRLCRARRGSCRS
jgi:hypothetical protein